MCVFKNASGNNVRNQVDECIENLCQRGCDVVRKEIDAIELGQQPDYMDTLTDNEQIMVLEELKIIMSVYDGQTDLDQ